MLKHTSIFLFIALVLIPLTSRAEQNLHSFTLLNTYSNPDYALSDALKFHLFDLSEVKISIHSKKYKKEVIEETLKKLPSYFYKSLKNQILEQQVPVTLYSSKIPDYSKALQLGIKVHTIDFTKQTVKLKISGHISNHSSKKLFSFEHKKIEPISNGALNLKEPFKNLSNLFMKDLALYLKTKF